MGTYLQQYTDPVYESVSINRSSPTFHQHLLGHRSSMVGWEGNYSRHPLDTRPSLQRHSLHPLCQYTEHLGAKISCKDNNFYKTFICALVHRHHSLSILTSSISIWYCHCQGQRQTAAYHSLCREGDWVQSARLQNPGMCRKDCGRPLQPPDTNSFRHSPLAGGCGPSGPKVPSRLQLASSTRPVTPTDSDCYTLHSHYNLH